MNSSVWSALKSCIAERWETIKKFFKSISFGVKIGYHSRFNPECKYREGLYRLTVYSTGHKAMQKSWETFVLGFFLGRCIFGWCWSFNSGSVMCCNQGEKTSLFRYSNRTNSEVFILCLLIWWNWWVDKNRRNMQSKNLLDEICKCESIFRFRWD